MDRNIIFFTPFIFLTFSHVIAWINILYSSIIGRDYGMNKKEAKKDKFSAGNIWRCTICRVG